MLMRALSRALSMSAARALIVSWCSLSGCRPIINILKKCSSSAMSILLLRTIVTVRVAQSVSNAMLRSGTYVSGERDAGPNLMHAFENCCNHLNRNGKLCPGDKANDDYLVHAPIILRKTKPEKQNKTKVNNHRGGGGLLYSWPGPRIC